MVSVLPGKQRTQFNIAAQGRRQAGSSFKTFVLVEAVRRGINPDSTTYLSAPFTWQPDGVSEPWSPKTYDGSYYGPSSLTASTLRSDNSVYAQLTLDLGPGERRQDRARDGRPLAAQAGGLDRPRLERRLRARHGVGDTRPWRPAASTTSRWRSAAWCSREAAKTRRPVGVSPGRKRVIPDGVAYQVTRILEQNMLSGTGTGAYFGRPAAGKTGTTDDHTDAWFVGYTPTLATAVWVGYPNATIEMTNVHGISVSGGSFPATIWNLFMSRALANAPVLDLPLPRQQVVWRPWHGEYQFSGDTSQTETDTTETDTTETETETAPSHLGGAGRAGAAPAADTATAPAEPPPPATEPPPLTELPPVDGAAAAAA